MSESIVDYPRYRVTMNGVILGGVERVQFTPALAYQIGTFQFDKTFDLNDEFPFSWWASTKTKGMRVVIEISTDGNTFTTMFTGNVDGHSYDMLSNKITAGGRDLAGALADQRTFSTLPNQTASEIATKVAEQNGLTPNVTATKQIVGRYYDSDYTQTQNGDGNSASNLWDLLCKVGSAAGVIPYVFGTTLYFNPPPETPTVFNAYFNRDSAGNVVANIEGMSLERHLTYARDVIVTVFSWHSKKKATATATIRTRTKEVTSTPANDPPSHFFIQKPNLTQDQCLALASQYALDYSRHERCVVIQARSLTILPPFFVVEVSGTETDYDIQYTPTSTNYMLSFKDGASTSIDAKNSSPLTLYNNDTDEQIGESP